MRRNLATLSMLLAILGVGHVAKSEPARKMRPTMYDDGIACPGDCDAHVVFASKHNGTSNAFLPPSSGRTRPSKCENGKKCVICFDEPDSSCIEAMYRGGGPPEGRFDFTPAFFTKTCTQTHLPAVLSDLCRQLEAEMEKYKSERLSCFENPENEVCKALLEAARNARDTDKPAREACIAEGEKAYNERQPDDTTKRINDCNYEFLRRGSNSNGDTWHILLPAACREGTFVGSFGTDCCYGDWHSAAHLHPECAKYFPKREDD